MKTIIILLFLVPLFCQGQKDTTTAQSLTTNNSLLTTWTTISYTRQDTTRCIMLICDTAGTFIQNFGMPNDNGINGNGYWLQRTVKRMYYEPFVYWQFGYEVHEWSNYFGSGKRYYLDENKLPMKKSIMVWQVKQLQHENL